MEQMNIRVSTIALRPSIHLYSGATLILLYFLFLQIRAKKFQMALPIVNVILIFSGFGLLQYLLGLESIYGIISVPRELRSPFFGSFINGNHAAYFMVCGVFLVHSVYKGILQYGCQTLLLISIVLCESRGAMSLTFVSLVWLYAPKYRLLTLISTIAVGITVTSTTDLALLTHGRWDMWLDSIQLARLGVAIWYWL